jgi:hypothetical protein
VVVHQNTYQNLVATNVVYDDLLMRRLLMAMKPRGHPSQEKMGWLSRAQKKK